MEAQAQVMTLKEALDMLGLTKADNKEARSGIRKSTIDKRRANERLSLTCGVVFLSPWFCL